MEDPGHEVWDFCCSCALSWFQNLGHEVLRKIIFSRDHMNYSRKYKCRGWVSCLKKENAKNDLSVRFGPRFETLVFPLGPEIVRAPGVAGTCLSASLKTKLFCKTPSFFEPGNVKNEAILRDFLNFGSWQHQKWSNTARLPSKMESWVQSWRPRTNACFAFSHSMCVKCFACHEKVRPGHTKCSTFHAKSS